MASARDRVARVFPEFAREVDRRMTLSGSPTVLLDVLADPEDDDRVRELLADLLAGAAPAFDLDQQDLRALAFPMLTAFLLGVWMGEHGKASLMARA